MPALDEVGLRKSIRTHDTGDHMPMEQRSGVPDPAQLAAMRCGRSTNSGSTCRQPMAGVACRAASARATMLGGFPGTREGRRRGVHPGDGSGVKAVKPSDRGLTLEVNGGNMSGREPVVALDTGERWDWIVGRTSTT
jgi:hypothetical protein